MCQITHDLLYMANISTFWPVAHLCQAVSHRSEFSYHKRCELFKKKIVTGYYQFLVYFFFHKALQLPPLIYLGEAQEE